MALKKIILNAEEINLPTKLSDLENDLAMVCAYIITSYTANHIELENYTYNGQTMNYREGAIISVLNPYPSDIVFEGGIVTLDGNEYETNAFTIKSGATILFSLGNDPGILYSISSVVESNSGSSSESGAAAYPEVNHGTVDTTFELTPNTFHVWDEVSELSLTLGTETAGVANEYLFQFNSGSTATTLTLPSDVKFSEDLTIEANKIYQISILKGLVSVLSWDTIVSIFPITLVTETTTDAGKQVYIELEKLGESGELEAGLLYVDNHGYANEITTFTFDSTRNAYRLTFGMTSIFLDSSGYCYVIIID